MIVETRQVRRRALCAQVYRRTDGRLWPFGLIREWQRAKRSPGGPLDPTSRWGRPRGVVLAGPRRCLALYVMDYSPPRFAEASA